MTCAFAVVQSLNYQFQSCALVWSLYMSLMSDCEFVKSENFERCLQFWCLYMKEVENGARILLYTCTW